MSELSLLPPNETLYVNNINEKIKKDVLKKNLYMLFSQYGKVKKIVACKGIKMRGQAWVIFSDVNSALNAIKGKQGFQFYDKPLRLSFAKSKSLIANGENKLVAPTTNKSLKRNREGTNDNKTKHEENNNEDIDDEEDIQLTKESKKEGSIVSSNLPNKILFVQNLPEDCTEQMLHMIFRQSVGFIEIRMVPGKKGMAFIEYDNEIQAGMSIRQFNGYQLTATNELQISFSN